MYLALGAGVRTVTSQSNGCGFDSNHAPLSMEFACFLPVSEQVSLWVLQLPPTVMKK